MAFTPRLTSVWKTYAPNLLFKKEKEPMAILTKDEFNSRMSEVFKDSDDNTLSVIEDFTDTFNDLYNRTESNRTADEIEREWRERYRKRFFGEDEEVEDIKKENKEDLAEEDKPKSFDDLFEERE